MRILILNRSRAVIGGVETYLKALLPLLASEGHEISFGYETEGPPGSETVTDLGPRTYQISGLADLRGALQRTNAEAIFLHGLNSVELEVAARTEKIVLYFLHAYHGTCISGTKRYAFPAVASCTRCLGPGCLAYYLPRRCGGFNPLIAAGLYRDQRRRQSLLQRADAVVIASDHMRSEGIRSGVEAAKLFVAPFFPTNQVRDLEPPLERKQSGELLFIGRITAVKGLHVLLEALPLVERQLGRRLALSVAGDGDDKQRIMSRAAELGIRATFHGWVDSNVREKVMRSADLLVMPSLWPEPFGIAGIEAASVGLPAAAFPTGGIREWLIPGISGEVSTGGADADGLADAIVRALSTPQHLQKLRVGAWENSARFSAGAHLRALRTAFASVNFAGTEM